MWILKSYLAHMVLWSKAIFSFLHVYLLLTMVFEIKDFVVNSSEFDVCVGVSEEATKRGNSSYLSC